MARDITVHFLGNARDLAASSAVAEASVDRFGNAAVVAGAKAEVASFGFSSMLAALIALAAAVVVVTAPITVLATTFAGLGAGVVALAAVTGNLGDVSGQAAASTEDLAAAQQKLQDLTTTAAISQNNYNTTVAKYGASSDQAKAALVSLHSAQSAVTAQQEKLNALQAQGQGPLAGLIADIKDMANALGQQAAPMAVRLISLLESAILPVQDLGSRLLDWFGQRLPTMLPIFTQIVQGLVAAVLWLGQGWGNLVDWFMAHWAGYTAALKSVFDQIGTGIHFVAPLLALVTAGFRQQLGPAIQFVRDHADSLKPLLYALGGVLVVVGVAAVALGAVLIVLVTAITAIASAISFAVNWLKNAVQWLGYLIDKAGGAAGAIRGIGTAIASLPAVGGIGQLLGNALPHFDQGGVVPGPIGAPTLAVVHGGEVVTPPGSRGPYNVTMYITGSGSAEQIAAVVDSRLSRLLTST